ncbi:MAG: VTT domain-containing protein [Acidobacteria bacterium]|nr:VTT domain-containing protein [Acidobacteriota bacterium]
METLLDLWAQVPSAEAIIRWGGVIALISIVFAETGLLVGFFLPGDSLLVTAGLFAARGDLNVVVLLVSLSIAAIVGDAVGYAIGRRLGPKLFKKEDSLLFKRKHLVKAHEFYERYGGKTIVIARFVPIIRTFAPTVAGAAEMTYSKFAAYNVFGGLLWVFSMVLGGYALGSVVPNIDKYIHYVIVIVVFLSLLPPVIEWWRERRRNAAEKRADQIEPAAH